jgi:exonuclease III
MCTQHQHTQFQTYSEGLKAYTDSNIVVVGDFNIPLSPIDRSFKQKINKEIIELNHTID